MSRRIPQIILAVFSTTLVFNAVRAQSQPAITASELRTHVQFLASDRLEGRGTGTAGERAAADYLAAEFRRLGIAPAGTSDYFQEFPFVAGVKLGSGNAASVSKAGKRTALTLDKDFRPLGFSSSGTFEGEVVFAGYGISLTQAGYDDYAGIDVTGKVVVLLRHHPDGENPHSPFGSVGAARYKTNKARELGAKAVILLTGPAEDDQDKLAGLSYDASTGDAGVPVIGITRAAAREYLGLDVAGLQDSINASRKPRSFALQNLRLEVSAEIIPIRQTGRNVLAYLEGSDPVLKNEVVLFGAHYDHLGLGGSGSLSPDTVAIHNGADDNASGTAGILELAGYFAARKKEIKRSILFLLFSGEERGLLGSAYYVKNPTIPLQNSLAMLNMDMIGRMNNRKLIVYGTGTSPTFETLVNNANADSTFDLKLVADGFGPSDHASFYGAGLPVFHFFTDLHSDYHKPSDDWNLLNYDGMVTVLRFVATIGGEILRAESRPSYVKVEAPRRPAGAAEGRPRSYTGTIPDFGEQVQGMKISGVTEGSPAAKAGLQGGDVIVKFGTIEIKNLYDYTFALGEYKPGDEVDVVVMRGAETKTLRLTIGRRP